MKTAIGLLIVFLAVAPAWANPPIDGTYQSTDLGGPMLTGRYAQSWSAPSGRLSIGNTTNSMSWDGATLGTQWWMYCADLAAPPVLLSDTVDSNGNGTRTWLTIFSGGLCILDGNGPWGDGSEPSYTAPFMSYSEINTEQYANFQLIAVVSSINMQAQFIGYSADCMSLSISNQEELGSTDTGALPFDYPSFLAPATCAPTRTLGSWGEADEFTLIVSGCTIPTQESSWGGIKALFE